jgi:HPt (histidine-containing phosphotransfer) domain-containing protein
MRSGRPVAEDDLELLALRTEFLGTFAEREAALVAAMGVRDFGAIGRLAHKLAGAAGSYGLPLISEVAGALEDFVAGANPGTEAVLGFAALLREMLERARLNQGDLGDLANDARVDSLLNAI